MGKRWDHGKGVSKVKPQYAVYEHCLVSESNAKVGTLAILEDVDDRVQVLGVNIAVGIALCQPALHTWSMGRVTSSSVRSPGFESRLVQKPRSGITQHQSEIAVVIRVVIHGIPLDLGNNG
jgi:hypothetical protein